MQKHLLALLFLVISAKLSAQDTAHIVEILKTNQIHVSSRTFVINNKIYPIIALKNILVTNPLALKNYNQYQSQLKVSEAFGLLLLAGIVGGIATYNNPHNTSGKIFTFSIAPALACGYFNFSARRHYHKAIKIYNAQF